MKFGKGLLALILNLGMGMSLSAQTEITTRIPSPSAGQEGIAVMIRLPQQARYGNAGAPVAVEMPGGFHGEGIGGSTGRLFDHGFIEIQFNFPGSGHTVNQSGGVYDYRGPNSLLAARDVLWFALGQIRDFQDRSLAEIVYPILPMTSNVGLTGYSNGGNTNLCVAGLHSRTLTNLAWILNWESPVGDGMPQAEAGSKSSDHMRPFNPDTNPAYDPDTGLWDLEDLKYNSQIRLLNYEQDGEVYGSLYWDFNQNSQVDPGEDYIAYPLVFPVPSGREQGFFSVRLRQWAEDRHLFPDPLPDHLPTLEQTVDFWRIRDGENWIDSILIHIPHLMFMVTGSETDHVQRALDHPHVLIQYSRFLEGGCRFVRLNPDRIYTEEILGQAAPDAVDNDAFFPFDHLTIRTAFEPGGHADILGQRTNGPAGACELADRTYFGNLDMQLDAHLTSVETIEEIPGDLHLGPNYPNPFNAETVIPFSVPRAAKVRLNLYSLMGRYIATLVDREMTAGTYTARLDATDLPSSLYLARLQADNHQETIKLNLVK